MTTIGIEMQDGRAVVLLDGELFHKLCPGDGCEVTIVEAVSIKTSFAREKAA